MNNNIKKLLVFHSALAPYRVDFFNMLGKSFDSFVVFLSRNNRNQHFNMDDLLNKVTFKYGYLDKKIVLKDRDFNYGYFSKIKENKPNIIMGAEYGFTILLPYFFRIIFKKKYKIYTICDDSLDIAEKCNGIRKILRNFLVSRIDGVIVLSDEVANWYSEKFNLKNKPIVFPLIRNEVSYRDELKQSLQYTKKYIEKYNLKSKKVYLFVGRLEKVKNLELLITSFDKVADTEDVLLLVGDGSQKPELELLVNKLGKKEQIFFCGRYENLELIAWYNLADCFLLPSIYEPFGAVVNEALAAGCPVVCSKYAGSSTLISENNGILFDPKKEGDLEKALIDFKNKNTLIPDKENVKQNLMNISFQEYTSQFTHQILKND